MESFERIRDRLVADTPGAKWYIYRTMYREVLIQSRYYTTPLSMPPMEYYRSVTSKKHDMTVGYSEVDPDMLPSKRNPEMEAELRHETRFIRTLLLAVSDDIDVMFAYLSAEGEGFLAMAKAARLTGVTKRVATLVINKALREVRWIAKNIEIGRVKRSEMLTWAVKKVRQKLRSPKRQSTKKTKSSSTRLSATKRVAGRSRLKSEACSNCMPMVSKTRGTRSLQ